MPSVHGKYAKTQNGIKTEHFSVIDGPTWKFLLDSLNLLEIGGYKPKNLSPAVDIDAFYSIRVNLTLVRRGPDRIGLLSWSEQPWLNLEHTVCRYKVNFFS